MNFVRILYGEEKDVSKCIENDMLELDFIQRGNVFTKII